MSDIDDSEIQEMYLLNYTAGYSLEETREELLRSMERCLTNRQQVFPGNDRENERYIGERIRQIVDIYCKMKDDLTLHTK